MSPVERFASYNVKERTETEQGEEAMKNNKKQSWGGYILSVVRGGVHVREAQLHSWLTVKAAELWGSLR